MGEMLYSASQEQSLMTEIWDPQIALNPEAFVMFAFPWGKEGTPLHRHQGPRTWQRDELAQMADHIEANIWRISEGRVPLVYHSATASGRGVGKSSLNAFVNIWNISCNIGSTSINTANTETQLKTRTWAELGKWHTLSINGHWFDKSTLSLRPAKWFSESCKKALKIDDTYYYSMAQLWSEENPDAFAGAHNPLGMMICMDEASGIPKPIWTVSEGFFTEPDLHRYQFAFSNPRRNTGAFFDCFHLHRDFWKTRNLDSRSVEGTDKQVLENIIKKHGEDSDEARIEVKGEFPEHGDDQFISSRIVDDAANRELIDESWAPLIMGVDPARKGRDSTVIQFRQGRDARSIPAIEMRKKDNMEVVDKCIELIEKYNPDAIAIDAGNGTGIIDRLRQLGYKVHEIWFGSKTVSKAEFANRRTELWALLREWLQGGCIRGEETKLVNDLKNMQWRFVSQTSDIQMLKTKKELEKEGIPSPDFGDALACTFAVKPSHRRQGVYRGNKRKTVMARGVDCDPFA